MAKTMKGKDHLIGNVEYIETHLASEIACKGCVFNDTSNHGHDYYECDMVKTYTQGKYDGCPATRGGQWVESRGRNYEVF
jgi:hypothetical protein